MRPPAKEPKYQLPHIPLILVVSPGGEPDRWITYDDYAKYKSKNNVLYSMGQSEYVLRGGINAKTMQRSTLIIDSIIAVANTTGKKRKNTKPALTNNALFRRDSNMCAYCGNTFRRNDLTRDHIHPISKGGPDVWENVVTCCVSCNQRKGNTLLSDMDDMKLLYKPYAPTHHEKLILDNRNLSKEQMEYLIIGVSPNSRVYKEYVKQKDTDENINEYA